MHHGIVFIENNVEKEKTIIRTFYSSQSLKTTITVMRQWCQVGPFGTLLRLWMKCLVDKLQVFMQRVSSFSFSSIIHMISIWYIISIIQLVDIQRVCVFVVSLLLLVFFFHNWLRLCIYEYALEKPSYMHTITCIYTYNINTYTYRHMHT